MLKIATSSRKSRLVQQGLVLLLGLASVGGALWWVGRGTKPKLQNKPAPLAVSLNSAADAPAFGGDARHVEVVLREDQQRQIGLRTERVALGHSSEELTAPGRISPDETKFAYITPRASGVIRSVNGVIGQDVRAGDLLATIDSQEVGTARLNLYAQLQELEVARAKADWEETIYHNTLELIGMLRKGESPETIHARFENRAVGENREHLMKLYVEYRLAKATFDRNKELHDNRVIAPKQFEQARASYEVALASYQALMDQMGYQSKLENVVAQQARRQAESAVVVAKERLNLLGVSADLASAELETDQLSHRDLKNSALGLGTDPVDGRKVDAKTVSDSKPGEPSKEARPVPLDPKLTHKDSSVSTYAISAPFDGTILDRETIVPGVSVDTTHRIFTMANLSVVWVEANVHESNFGKLASSRGGRVRFHSPAYPDRAFDGTVIYTGDLVDEKSRSVKVLARADNPERLLKPGMYVEVEIHTHEPKAAIQVPATALLTEGDHYFVFVKTGPERFEHRSIETDDPSGERVTVQKGLSPGEELVIQGAYKLKAETLRLSSAQR